MKTSLKSLFSLAIATSIAFLSSSTIQAATPLVYFNFNEGSGSEAFNGGSLTTGYSLYSYNASGTQTSGYYTSSGSGVSGLAGDYAFDTGSTGGASSGYMRLQTLGTLDNFKSFTLAGWMKADSYLGASRIMSNTDGLNGFMLMGNSTSGSVQLQVNGATLASTSNALYGGSIGQWVFFAVTCDLTTGNAIFYKGTTSGSLVTESYTFTPVTMAELTGTAQAGTLYIGNRYGGDRAFDGSFDNIAIYGSSTDGSGVLSSAEIEALRLSAIPEPATICSLLLGGFLFAACATRNMLRFRKPKMAC